MCLSFYEPRSVVVEAVARWDALRHMGQLPAYEQQLMALEALQARVGVLGLRLGFGVGVGVGSGLY